MTTPRIIRMLELSTAHLPRELGDLKVGSLAETSGVIAHELPYGFLMWVPDDPGDSAVAEAPPAEVLAIQLYARRHACDFVRFDADADPVDDLPRWEW